MRIEQEHEEEKVAITIDSIIDIVSTYVKNESSLEIIRRAYHLAESQHTGQLRKSGEPYILHPLEVAYILALWQTGPKTIAAGLMHDVLEDTEITYDELATVFNEDIASLVDGVTKLTKLDYVSKESAQAENHRKMLLAMSRDIRVILIKLADRLHNTRTLKHLRPDKQVRIAQETMDIYVPIAHRLGMFQVKAEFEDTCLRYLNPEAFYEIVRLMNKKKSEREENVERMINRISGILEAEGFNFNIKGRIKNIYSIYKKMKGGDKVFEEIYDLLAIRLIVDSLQDCYSALGSIHANFKPIPNRFKDYIAMPKPNMYQSLHTTVISLRGNIYEIQIRTKEMDEIAEKGVAAHWAYKENARTTTAQEQREIQDKLKWYETLSTYEDEVNDAQNLLEFVKEDIFNANIYVFTPQGDVLDFPPNSTPIDFAYRVHTDLGHRTTGAIVNGKIVPLTYHLKMGDVIEIKSNRNSFGPSEEWLNFVGTTQARHKIKQFFNKAKRQDNIIRGEELFLVELKAMNKTLADIDLKKLADMNKKLVLGAWEDLYHDLGRGYVLAKTILDRYFEKDAPVDEGALLAEINEKKKTTKAKNRYGIIVDGLVNVDIKIAKCCYPIPGDEVVGFITKTAGIAIHHATCPNLKDKERFVDVWFTDEIKTTFVTKIRIKALSRKNILSDIITKVSGLNINIESLNTTTQRETATIDIELAVSHLDALERSATALRSVKDVFSVERVIG
jgi:GTP pyrophosphokinase